MKPPCEDCISLPICLQIYIENTNKHKDQHEIQKSIFLVNILKNKCKLLFEYIKHYENGKKNFIFDVQKVRNINSFFKNVLMTNKDFKNGNTM